MYLFLWANHLGDSGTKNIKRATISGTTKVDPIIKRQLRGYLMWTNATSTMYLLMVRLDKCIFQKYTPKHNSKGSECLPKHHQSSPDRCWNTFSSEDWYSS